MTFLRPQDHKLLRRGLGAVLLLSAGAVGMAYFLAPAPATVTFFDGAVIAQAKIGQYRSTHNDKLYPEIRVKLDTGWSGFGSVLLNGLGMLHKPYRVTDDYRVNELYGVDVVYHSGSTHSALVVGRDVTAEYRHTLFFSTRPGNQREVRIRLMRWSDKATEEHTIDLAQNR